MTKQSLVAASSAAVLTMMVAPSAKAQGNALRFEAQEIKREFGVGYAVSIVDMNGDTKPDILAINGPQLVWFENPSWTEHVVLDGQTPKDNVAIAPHDIDGDGRMDVALGSGWNPRDTEGGGNSTRAQAQAKGAAVFVRGEGAWYGNGKIYFVSTSGGDDRGGQVFAYDPADETLTLFVEAVRDSADPALADNNGFIVAAPDNVAVGPDGRLYLCEDGSGVEKVVGVDLNGDLYEAARNVIGGDMGNGSEFAGVCFSHDGRFMFVNIQSPGLTCVIRGPWRKGQRG